MGVFTFDRDDSSTPGAVTVDVTGDVPVEALRAGMVEAVAHPGEWIVINGTRVEFDRSMSAREVQSLIDLAAPGSGVVVVDPSDPEQQRMEAERRGLAEEHARHMAEADRAWRANRRAAMEWARANAGEHAEVIVGALEAELLGDWSDE